MRMGASPLGAASPSVRAIAGYRARAKEAKTESRSKCHAENPDRTAEQEVLAEGADTGQQVAARQRPPREAWSCSSRARVGLSVENGGGRGEKALQRGRRLEWSTSRPRLPSRV